MKRITILLAEVRVILHEGFHRMLEVKKDIIFN
jgi:hypothetical protein